MGRRRTDENLREAILDAAQTVLGNEPAALTSRTVQATAGVSAGTFFHYFPTMDALLMAVAERAAASQRTSFGDVASEGIAPLLARLFASDRRDFVLPWLRQRAIVAPELRRGLRRYDDAVAAELLAGIGSLLGDAGVTDSIDVEAAIEVVRAMAEAFQLRLASHTLAVSPERFAATAVALILRGAMQTETAQ